MARCSFHCLRQFCCPIRPYPGVCALPPRLIVAVSVAHVFPLRLIGAFSIACPLFSAPLLLCPCLPPPFSPIKPTIFCPRHPLKTRCLQWRMRLWYRCCCPMSSMRRRLPVFSATLLLFRHIVPSPPLTPFCAPPLGSVRFLWCPVSQGVCRQSVICHAEVPVKALPRRPRQEGAAVFALASAYAIRAMTPGISAFTSLTGRVESCAG